MELVKFTHRHSTIIQYVSAVFPYKVVNTVLTTLRVNSKLRDPLGMVINSLDSSQIPWWHILCLVSVCVPLPAVYLLSKKIKFGHVLWKSFNFRWPNRFVVFNSFLQM